MIGSDKSFPLVILFVAILSVTFLAWNTTGSYYASTEVIEVRFATVAPDGTPWSEQALRMKERIERESEGRIRFVPYLGGQLGDEISTLRSLQRGRIQAWGGSVGAVTTMVPELQILELPYLFMNDDEVDYILDHLLYEPFSEILARRGFILHSWNENGWRHIGTKRNPALKPSDLRGIKIRSQESSMHVDMWRAWGAHPVPISIPEVMSALQTGLVDAFDNSTLFASATGWYQAVDHFVLTHHMYQAAVIVYNKRFWDSLPEDLREILLGDPLEEAEFGRSGVRAIEPELWEFLESERVEVHQLTPEEREEFARIVRPIHDKYRNIVGEELFDRMHNVLEEYRNESAGN